MSSFSRDLLVSLGARRLPDGVDLLKWYAADGTGFLHYEDDAFDFCKKYAREMAPLDGECGDFVTVVCDCVWAHITETVQFVTLPEILTPLGRMGPRGNFYASQLTLSAFFENLPALSALDADPVIEVQIVGALGLVSFEGGAT